MDGLRDQLLARARLAPDQDRGVGRGGHVERRIEGAEAVQQQFATQIISVINNPNSSSPGGSPVTVAFDINDRGQIVGYFTDKGVYRAYYVDEPSRRSTGGVGQSFALGINNAGHIVRYFNSATGDHGYLASPTAEAQAGRAIINAASP